MKIAYICDGCGVYHDSNTIIADCIYCGIEVCDSCMLIYNTCCTCAKDKTDEEMKRKFNESIP